MTQKYTNIKQQAGSREKTVAFPVDQSRGHRSNRKSKKTPTKINSPPSPYHTYCWSEVTFPTRASKVSPKDFKTNNTNFFIASIHFLFAIFCISLYFFPSIKKVASLSATDRAKARGNISKAALTLRASSVEEKPM